MKPSAKSTPNGEGITMTPAMVSAGLAVYLKWKSSDDYREDDLMRAIFGAMTLASLTAMPAPQDMEIMQAWHSERERGTARDSFDYFAAGFQAARSEVLQTEPHDESKIASLCAWVHTMCAPEELSDYAIERALRAAIDYGRETTSMRSEIAPFDGDGQGGTETPGTWEERCAALYQVVGCLADMAGIFTSSEDVSNALDVACGRGDVENLLPWPKDHAMYEQVLKRNAAPQGSATSVQSPPRDSDVAPAVAAPVFAPSATRRRLHSLDSYCPACGHNRDTSAISSVNNDDGTHYCQKCSTEWGEV